MQSNNKTTVEWSGGTTVQNVLSDEGVRKEVASLLHSHVQSRLSACNVWLAQAERLLLEGSAPSLSHPVGDDAREAELFDAAERIVEALELLHKVRSEVEQLRKQEVQRAVRRLYPTLISLGLRPALEALQEDLFKPGGQTNEPSGPSVQWDFTDRFVRVDGPDGDEAVLGARLELYRLIEALLRAARAADEPLAATMPDLLDDAAEVKEPRLHLQFQFDARADAFHLTAFGGCITGRPLPGEMLQFLAASLPYRRFRGAGGTLLVGADDGGRFRVQAAMSLAGDPR